MSRTLRKWTEEEENLLLRQVKANPQNLKQCFISVSRNIDRTPLAVTHHWYRVLSKKTGTTCFFTASPHHVSKNRKNGRGISCNRGVWYRLLGIIKNL